MVCLQISADISQNKLVEFNQSKHSFINELQQVDGYSGFTEKPGNPFLIKIMWKDRTSLNKFIKSEFYHVFNGALITLSKSESTQILIN